MALLAITQLFLVLANCVLWTETDLQDKRRIEIKFLQNIFHKRLKSKRKATKLFAKTLFRIESCLRSITYVRGLTCSSQHSNFVLQDIIAENGRASWSRCIKTSKSQFARAYMCNIKIYAGVRKTSFQNGFSCYKLVIASTSEFYMIQWDWFRGRNRRHSWFKKKIAQKTYHQSD